MAYKDCVFLSPHKMVGGPGTSGVLLARESILASSKPYRLGGAIVFFVNETEHEFYCESIFPLYAEVIGTKDLLDHEADSQIAR